MILDSELHHRYGPLAIVAGASEGIGRAFAHALAEKGLDLLLIARRAEPLEAEAALLRRRHRVRVDTLPLDLGAPTVSARVEEALGGREVGLLVYNACYSAIGEFLDVPLEQKLQSVAVNCHGVLALTSLVAPRLAARGRGGILLMSSLAGFQGAAMVGTYAATKAFDTVLGESLYDELRPHGVDVLVCAAGATSTPGFESQTPASKRASAMPMRPEAVAEAALAHLGDGPLFIPGAVNRFAALLFHLVGRRRASVLMSQSTRALYRG